MCSTMKEQDYPRESQVMYWYAFCQNDVGHCWLCSCSLRSTPTHPPSYINFDWAGVKAERNQPPYHIVPLHSIRSFMDIIPNIHFDMGPTFLVLMSIKLHIVVYCTENLCFIFWFCLSLHQYFEEPVKLCDL